MTDCIPSFGRTADSSNEIMAEKPFEKLLHRELQKHDVEEHFRPQLEMLRDVVNYGTNLVPATLNSSNRDMPDVIITTVLLKQVVRMLDAFEVLMSNGCVPAGALPARAAFEASVNLDWMLQGDSHLKALHFYVSNLRRQAVWARRAITGDAESNRFTESLGEFAEQMVATQERLRDGAEEHAAEISALLAKPPYDEINRRFDEARGSRPYEPAWHVSLGVRSVRAMSEAVGRLHEYEIFYGQFSETMHASWYKEHIQIQKGQIQLEPIRHLEGLGTVFNFVACTAFHAYQAVLARYRPGQLNEFSERYVSDWRTAFKNIPNVRYQVQTDAAG